MRTECVLVLHHACETLLRLFFAHSENQHCPWLGMAASVNFAEFEEKVAAALRNGFDRDAVALVFLGGADPDDSALDVEANEFDETVSAWQLLLETAAHTVLSESFLYNAAKHGLTIVHTDESTQMAFTPPGGDPVQLHAGSQFAYLHRPQTPGVKGGTEWWVSLTHTLPDQDIQTASLVQQAISSLWNVARRRYTGQASQVWLVPAQAVRNAIYGPVAVKGDHVRTLTHELVKKDADGRFNAVHMHLTGRGLPDESQWSPGVADDGLSPRQITLPARQQDKRIVSTSSRKLLPFAPNWSSRV